MVWRRARMWAFGPDGEMECAAFADYAIDSDLAAVHFYQSL